MLVEKNYQGNLVLSELDDDGRRFHMVYNGYTKKEAIRLFKQHIKEQLTKIGV